MANETTMIFRIDPESKAAFEEAAKELDLTSSQMLRRMVKQVVEQREQTRTERHSQPTPKKGQKMASVKPANWRKQ